MPTLYGAPPAHTTARIVIASRLIGDDTERTTLPTPQETHDLWQEAPTGYVGHHRRQPRGLARPVTVAAIVGIWALALTAGLHAVGAW